MIGIHGLPPGFWEKMESELGRQEALRILWPAIVGKRLAATSQLKALRGSMLIVAVPDREWRAPLESLWQMIIDSVNRFCGKRIAESIETIESAWVIERSVTKKSVGAFDATATRRTAPPDLTAITAPVRSIQDGDLRAAFIESAKKYFAMQEGRRH